MYTDKIFNESGQRFTRTFSLENVVKVNPIEYFQNYERDKRATIMYDYINAKNPFLASLINRDNCLLEAKNQLIKEGFIEKFEQIKVHGNFEQLLITGRKKDQLKLLDGMSINPDELVALIFKSFSDYDYLYSRFRFEILPNGLEGIKLPKLFHMKEDGTIEKVGETGLTDGELKNIIQHRKVIVSNFLENEDTWHCFFITYNSIAGQEDWKGGQAHFHYISSAFGITKEDFIDSMRTGRYRSTRVHIDLLDYGRQSV